MNTDNTDSDSETELISDIRETLNLENLPSLLKSKRKIIREARFSPISRPSASETSDLHPSISENIANNTMANPNNSVASNVASVVNQNILADKSEINLLLNAIPNYFPGDNLSIFINEVDNLINHLSNRLTGDLGYIVSFSIRSKVKGDARDFLAYQNATQWPEIRAALLSKYGDQ